MAENYNETHCVRCKKVTLNKDGKIVISKNRRNILSSICSECGCKKSRFVPSNVDESEVEGVLKEMEGGSILNWLIEHNPVELHLIDQGDDGLIRKSSFDGPGSRLDERLNPDGSWKSWSKPINKLDHGAYIHDLAYQKYKDIENRNIADSELEVVANEVVLDPGSTLIQRTNAKLVRKIMQYKVKNHV